MIIGPTQMILIQIMNLKMTQTQRSSVLQDLVKHRICSEKV